MYKRGKVYRVEGEEEEEDEHDKHKAHKLARVFDEPPKSRREQLIATL
ncbi:MAG TPA: hypothetical protein VE244_06285 [Nitrososphaeraceae archaeon]|jgi:hypothetical protein|nr:hypothetical protein [Nitrososphaeraceae archaeon]